MRKQTTARITGNQDPGVKVGFKEELKVKRKELTEGTEDQPPPTSKSVSKQS